MVNTYALKKTLSSLCSPYFILNGIASVLHPIVRWTPGFCEYFGSSCQLDFYECEIYFFVICVVVIKNRKSVSIESYLSTLYMFAKGASLILFYKMDIQLCLWYLLLCVVLLVAIKPPVLDESSEMKYFVDDSLPQVLRDNPEVTWIVEFYTTFSPHCNALKPVFAALSREYTHEYIKFGKCDVLKAYGVPEMYGISSSCLKTELPAIIIFENGKPAARIKQRMNGKPYVMTYENLKRDLLIQDFYGRALEKAKLKSKKKKKTN